MAKKNGNDYILFGIDFGANEKQRELIKAVRADPRRKPVVFVSGEAGTGKTFASLAASLSLVREHGAKKHSYECIYYIREPVEVGHRLGYLKGKEEDKFAPYLGPLIDNYNHLVENDPDAQRYLRQPSKKGKEDADDLPNEYRHLPYDIIPLAPEFLRGRSFRDCIIICDEAQNMDLSELHTLVTRIGEGVKLIIIGSANQIDTLGQTYEDNAFMTSIEILKETGLTDHIRLVEPMRSSFVAEFDRLFVEYAITHKK